MSKKKHNKKPVAVPLELVPVSNGHIAKLDLSYGELPKDYLFIRPDGFDPMKLPWPFKDNSIEEANSAFLFQRVPAKQRGEWMDELYRVLVPKGRVTVIVPYYSSARSVQDYLAEWPPLSENSFLYFTKPFRDQNKLDYPVKCNFSFTYGYDLDPEVATRNDETRAKAAKTQLNAVSNLHIVLTKEP